ncbi:NUDIX domain-containing protein [archaeon]|nr:NUDIX domain-containing protein [archaeon]MBL7057472.1 NUDIX domain-containing protein [Candidatus Woesearchaeota archaeon]
MKQEKERIIQKLIHKPVMSFNELWDKQGSSNLFTYHLNSLIKDKLVEKTEKGYQLTHKGKKQAAYIEGETGKDAKFPLVGSIVVVFNEDKDKVLMMQRKKEPFYNYWGFVGGKLTFEQYILECAKEELDQEAGLECDLELKGLFSSKTYNNEKLSYNHQMFIVKGVNPRGKLKKETREGSPKWINIKDVEKLTKFPNVPYVIDIALSKEFKWLEADRIQENDEFVEMKILKNQTV